MTDRERLELLLEAYEHQRYCDSCRACWLCDEGEKRSNVVDAIREYLRFTKTEAVTGGTQERIPKGSGWPPVE